jgi:peptidoglycan/xylan/chitin deacetylase (PgdA/CDA1 family)
MRRLKSLPDAERRAALERDFGHTDEREYGAPRALSAEQLREFLALGGTVGSHTHFHPLLARCEDDTGLNECRQSREVLEKLVERNVCHFALPNGGSDARTRGWIIRAGYKTCRTTHAGWVTPKTDPLALPDCGIADSAGRNKAVVQASGALDLIKYFLRCLQAHD